MNNSSISTFCPFTRFIIFGLPITVTNSIGIVFNVLAAIIWRNLKSKSTTTVLVIFLEIADTIFLIHYLIVLGIPYFLEYVNFKLFKRYSAIRAYGLKYTNSISEWADAASNWATVLISVERYIAVCKPFAYKNITKLRTIILVSALYFGLFVVYIIQNYEYETKFYPEKGIYEIKGTNLKKNKLYAIAYRLVFITTISILIPFVVVLVVTIMVFKKLKRTLKGKMVSNQLPYAKRTKQVTRSLLAVNVLFIGVYSFEIFRIVITALFVKEMLTCGHFLFYYHRLAIVLKSINSSVNFFLFSLLNSIFRKKTRQLFCGESSSINVAPTHTTD